MLNGLGCHKNLKWVRNNGGLGSRDVGKSHGVKRESITKIDQLTLYASVHIGKIGRAGSTGQATSYFTDRGLRQPKKVGEFWTEFKNLLTSSKRKTRSEV